MMSAPPSASLGPTLAWRRPTATAVAHKGSDARMMDASVDGSLEKTLAVSQIVSDVEIKPV